MSLSICLVVSSLSRSYEGYSTFFCYSFNIFRYFGMYYFDILCFIQGVLESRLLVLMRMNLFLKLSLSQLILFIQYSLYIRLIKVNKSQKMANTLIRIILSLLNVFYLQFTFMNTNKNKNMKLNNNIYSDKKQNNFITSLPKANQIVDTTQEVKKSIYPFLMKCRKNNTINYQQQPYQNNLSNFRFIPPRQSILQHFNTTYIIYDKFNNNKDDQLFNVNIFPIERLKNFKNIDYVINVEHTKPFENLKNALTFDSRFQSGNLSIASKVEDLYCLLLHSDINTFGYTNWFYFCVRTQNQTNNQEKIMGKQKFAIMNYGKAGRAFSNGVKICTFTKERGWQRKGTNIYCQRNSKIYEKRSSYNSFNTLYFEYEFEENQTQVYFAYNIPYTYTHLCSVLDSIQSKEFSFFHRKLAGLSMSGNRLQLITITNFQILKTQNLPVIVLLARAHPGETVSSWVMHNFIQFLISDEPQAKTLRDNFTFKIFPMINPDGVIHGNYRCSLSGRDLNRRWIEASKDLFPEVYYIKNQIMEISKKRTIKMVLDLHGHSYMKKVFAYGCNQKAQPHKCRLFPYMLSKLTEYFQFRYCNFYIDKSKLSTARVTLFNYLKIPHIFTIETSQYGTSDGHHSGKVFKEMGQSIAQGILMLFHIKIKLKKQIEIQKIQNQLMNDTSLIKIGIEKDTGSDSQPSVDNIKYDNLDKLTKRRQMRINSNIVEKKKCPKSAQKTIFKPNLEKRRMSESLKITAVNKNISKSRDNSFKSNIFLKVNQTPRIVKTADGRRNYSIRREKKVIEGEYVQIQTSKKHFTPKYEKKAEPVKFINFSLSIHEVGSRQKKIKQLEHLPFDWKVNSGSFMGNPRLISRNYSQTSRR